MIDKWKNQLLERIKEIFFDDCKWQKVGESADTDQLYQQIGQLKIELNWLKKICEIYRWFLGKFINWYNNERIHSSLSYKKPVEVYLGKVGVVKKIFVTKNH
jgi:transposase InsO family protein